MSGPALAEYAAAADHEAESLGALFRHEAAAAHLVGLMQLGYRHGAEGAFGVYDSGDISGLTHPELDGASHINRWGDLEVDMSPIVGSTLDGSWRTDVLLNVHTHPPTARRPQKKAYPSTGDMSVFRSLSHAKETAIHGVLSWSQYTPVDASRCSLRGLRAALSAGDDRYATLFLMRQNPPEYCRVYDDIFNMTPGYYPENETWEAFTASADARGWNYAQLPVDPRTGRVLDDSSLPHLFYSGASEVPRNARLV